MIYGYARVSDKEQHTDRQIVNIRRFATSISDEDIFVGEISGKTFDRPQLSILKRILRPGDEVVLSELDRLGRNKRGILDELDFFRAKNVKLRCLDIPTTLLDLQESSWLMEMVSNILVEVYTSLAQQEVERKESRQQQGIAEAKKRGVYRGRKPIQIDITRLSQVYSRWRAGHLRSGEAQKILGLKRNTFYRRVALYEKENTLGRFAESSN